MSKDSSEMKQLIEKNRAYFIDCAKAVLKEYLKKKPSDYLIPGKYRLTRT